MPNQSTRRFRRHRAILANCKRTALDYRLVGFNDSDQTDIGLQMPDISGKGAPVCEIVKVGPRKVGSFHSIGNVRVVPSNSAPTGGRAVSEDSRRLSDKPKSRKWKNKVKIDRTAKFKQSTKTQPFLEGVRPKAVTVPSVLDAHLKK